MFHLQVAAMELSELVSGPVFCASLLTLFTVLLAVRWALFRISRPMAGLVCLITGGAGELGELVSCKSFFILIIANKNSRRSLADRITKKQTHSYLLDDVPVD